MTQDETATGGHFQPTVKLPSNACLYRDAPNCIITAWLQIHVTRDMVDSAMAPNVKPETQTKPQNDTFAALRIPSFAWFLAGTTLSNAGQWIQQVTLSWLIYDITSSGAMLGTLNLVRSLATIGLAPMAGVAIDRFSQRKLLYAAALWLCAISIGFGVALLGNPQVVWPLFLFSFLGGIGQAVSIPLRQTVVFSVVPRSLAPTGVALVQTGWAVMRSLGPALGGFLNPLVRPGRQLLCTGAGLRARGCDGLQAHVTG